MLPFHPILVLPLCTHLFTITGTPRSPLLYKIELANEAACVYISPPSCSSRRALNRSRIQSFSLPLSSYFTYSRASPSQQSSSGTAVRTILAGFLVLSQLSVDALCSLPILSLFSPSLLCLDDTFTLATPILDTLCRRRSRLSTPVRPLVVFLPVLVLHCCGLIRACVLAYEQCLLEGIEE